MRRDILSSTEFISSHPNREIQDWEFTLNAIKKMNNVATVRDFELKDADIIYDFLQKELDRISAISHLKRYIYEKAELEEAFSQVSNDEYREIIMDSFKESGTPYSRKALKRRASAVVNDWLSHKTLHRETVFLLGFGLHMSDEDVEIFLQKALGEEGFNYHDPWEFICYFCFHTGENYQKAVDLLQYYENLNPEEIIFNTDDMRLFKNMEKKPEIYIFQENLVRDYLRYLRKYDIKNIFQEKMYQYFVEMYDRIRIIISEDPEYLYEKKKKYFIDAKMVSKGDVEQRLYSGIPVSPNGNLLKISESSLGEIFEGSRLTRQRMDGLLKRKTAVSRMDLLTFQFYIYAKTVEPDWPAERYLKYIRESNKMLEDCGMIGIYPVNPYEAFLLMCLNTEDSIATFSEVWEMSYHTK